MHQRLMELLTNNNFPMKLIKTTVEVITSTTHYSRFRYVNIFFLQNLLTTSYKLEERILKEYNPETHH